MSKTQNQAPAEDWKPSELRAAEESRSDNVDTGAWYKLSWSTESWTQSSSATDETVARGGVEALRDWMKDNPY